VGQLLTFRQLAKPTAKQSPNPSKHFNRMWRTTDR